MNQKIKLFIFVIFVFVTLVTMSYASCGSANCPIDIGSSERRERGWIRLSADVEYVNQSTPRIGTRRASVGEISSPTHDEVSTISRIYRLGASVGLTDRLSLDLKLPFVSRTHRHIDNDSGGVLVGWGFTGVGDLTVLANYAFYKPSEGGHPTLSVILGGKFPTGVHNKANDDGEIAEPGIQPGTGSYDLIIGGSAVQTFSVPSFSGAYITMPVFFSTTYQANGRSADNYKLGNTFLTNLGANYPLLKEVGFLAQLNLRVRETDLRGNTDQDTEKTGGEFLYFSPGLEYRSARDWSVLGVVQVPIYQRVNQIQLTSDYNLLASVSYRFKLGISGVK